jgi:hypothetical protein
MGGCGAYAEDAGRHGRSGHGLMHFTGCPGGVGGAWRPSPPTAVRRLRRSRPILGPLGPMVAGTMALTKPSSVLRAALFFSGDRQE